MLCSFHFLVVWFGLVWCSVEGKIGGEDYRKRSRPKECAGVESKGKTRDMERKRECGANRAKQGDGSDESPLCVECLPISVGHLEAFIKLHFADLIAALAILVICFSLPWKVSYFIAFLNWQAGFRASGVEFCGSEIGVGIIARHIFTL